VYGLVDAEQERQFRLRIGLGTSGGGGVHLAKSLKHGRWRE
jgi:hypothetical protein